MIRCGHVIICPVCGQPLAGTGRTFRCAQGHSFDAAREGYLHLLPVGHGRTRIEGDMRAMAQARRRFLDAGHFERISDTVNERVRRHLGALPPREAGAVVVDAGCGVGYYIGRLAQTLADSGIASSCCFGLDLSKEVVRLAARAYPDVHFLVNDVKQRICLADASVDVLLDIFAPRGAAEFARVLRPGGRLIVVIPEDDHVHELRARFPLLGTQPEKRERVLETLGVAFELVEENSLRYTTEPAGEDVADFLRMTPNLRHLSEETIAGGGSWSGPITVSVRVLELCRGLNGAG